MNDPVRPESGESRKPVVKKMTVTTRESVVYVGRKPVMAYVTAVMMQLNNNNKVTLKARGRSISRAVDVAEIVRKRFVQDAKITNIVTDTEQLTTEDNRLMNVSSISIVLEK